MKLFSYYLENKKNLYLNTENWTNNVINDMLLYSYRNTKYSRVAYPSNLHYHDYYELLIVEEGNIKYICDSTVYYPKFADIIIIPPGKFHMSAINDENTTYKRHVFYFYPSAFDAISFSCLCSFLDEMKSGAMFSLESYTEKQELITLLDKLNSALSGEDDELETALAFGYILQIFYFLNKKMLKKKTTISSLPENVIKIQQYIYKNYTSVSSVSEVAKALFYSREHTSRLFKQYFGITVSEYIMQCRIAQSQLLIMKGLPIADTAYKVGFGSISTFIRSFTKTTGMTPSEYKKSKKSIEQNKN